MSRANPAKWHWCEGLGRAWLHAGSIVPPERVGCQQQVAWSWERSMRDLVSAVLPAIADHAGRGGLARSIRDSSKLTWTFCSWACRTATQSTRPPPRFLVASCSHRLVARQSRPPPRACREDASTELARFLPSLFSLQGLKVENWSHSSIQEAGAPAARERSGLPGEPPAPLWCSLRLIRHFRG